MKVCAASRTAASSAIGALIALGIASPATAAQAAPELSDCSYFKPGPPEARSPIPYDPSVVFFAHDSAAITAEGARMLGHIAREFSELDHCLLIVVAHTDRTGSEAYNVSLSRRRADAVLSVLRRRGVSMAALLQVHGETVPMVETRDGVAEAQNRRAEILIAPLRRR